MSLDRFTNKDEIIKTDGSVRAVTWNQEDLDILKLDILDEIAQTATDHRLTDYSAAIVYHSKKFSNQ